MQAEGKKKKKKRFIYLFPRVTAFTGNKKVFPTKKTVIIIIKKNKNIYPLRGRLCWRQGCHARLNIVV